MKLIIDIPEVDYECAKQRWMRGNDAHKMDYYISKGIPLDDVMAELQKLADDTWNMSVGSVSQGLEDAIEILDNIGKAENEK